MLVVTEAERMAKVDEFKRLNETLCADVFILQNTFQLWQYLVYSDAEERQAKNDIFNRYGFLFDTVIRSTYSSIVLAITKMVECDRKSFGLAKYLHKTEQEAKYIVLDETSRDQLYKELRKHKDLINQEGLLKALKLRRDKMEAHSEKEYRLNPDKIAKEAPIDKEEVAKFIKDCMGVLDWHRENVLGLGRSPWIDLEDDAYFLLKDLSIAELLKSSDATKYLEFQKEVILK